MAATGKDRQIIVDWADWARSSKKKGSPCKPGCPWLAEKEKKDKDCQDYCKSDDKKRDPKNLKQVSKSASAHCCACCCLFGEYLKEMGKAYLCVLRSGGFPHGECKIRVLLCQMFGLLVALGKDAFCALRLVLQCLASKKKKI